jgi:hypothetical protein
MSDSGDSNTTLHPAERRLGQRIEGSARLQQAALAALAQNASGLTRQGKIRDTRSHDPFRPANFRDYSHHSSNGGLARVRNRHINPPNEAGFLFHDDSSPTFRWTAL